MYEFMVGYVPFGEMAEDPMQVYYSIINELVKFLFLNLINSYKPIF